MIQWLKIDDLYLHGGDGTFGLNGFSIQAAVRRDATARARAHGSLDSTEFYDGATIHLAGFIEVDDPADIETELDTLRQTLALGSDHLLTFQRRGVSEGEQAFVRVAGALEATQQPDYIYHQPFAVDLFTADPRIYSMVPVSGSYDPTSVVNGQGTAQPFVFPLQFSATTDGLLSVANNGTFPTPATFTIVGPISQQNASKGATIRNEATGDEIVLTPAATLIVGDTLEIDVATRTVILNGTAKRPDLIDAAQTTWFDLPVGISELRLEGSGMSSGQTDLAVTFRNARVY